MGHRVKLRRSRDEEESTLTKFSAFVGRGKFLDVTFLIDETVGYDF